MPVLDKLACALGRNGEGPNKALAEEISRTGDSQAVAELVEALASGSPAQKSDSIKTLYEIGERRPELLAPHAEAFLPLLRSKNNRLIWGAMHALACVAVLRPEPIFARLDWVLKAMAAGSVITVDNAVSVLAKVGAARPEYEKEILPHMLAHLSACRAKEIPQHAERSLVMANAGNKEALLAVLDGRWEEMSPTQQSRVARLMKRLHVI